MRMGARSSLCEAMDGAKRLYTEGLGWQVQPGDGCSVFFEPPDGSFVGVCATRQPRRPGQTSPEGIEKHGRRHTRISHVNLTRYYLCNLSFAKCIY
jgi:hypothetical protein